MNRWNRLVNMAIAYIRRHENASNIEIVFRYNNAPLGIDRVFNFQRNVSETITSSLNRIKTNVDKEFNKKLKKKPKKKTPTAAGSSDASASPPPSPPPLVITREVDLLTADQCGERSATTTWSDLLANVDQHEFNGSKLKVFGQEFTLAYNYPYVSNITMPTVMLVGFCCYPSKFDVEFTERDKCQFEWYRGRPLTQQSKKDSSCEIEWSKCEQEGFFYDVQATDLRHKLKLICTPKAGTKVGPSLEIESDCVVEAGPGYNPFEMKQQFTPNRLPSTHFRVMSYNLLADYYADSDFSRNELFSYCPPFALAIDYRKLLFIREILGYHADICCFQEVDAKVFDLDLTLCLGNDGMDGVLQKKGETAEGVATFYHRDKFELIQRYGFNLAEEMAKKSYFAPLYDKIKSNTKLCERMLLLSTALQVTILRSKANGQYLIVANTHLYFHPDADHIRLLQIGFFMLYVKHIYQSTIAELKLNEQQISIVFCGDFNSVPECGIYKLMTEKFVPDDFIDFKSNAEEAVKGVSLDQPFEIKSAYNNPKYTNFTVGFAACLDYIFYQSNNLIMLQAVPLPSDEELKSLTAIPSIVFPSDHIALVADFQWSNSK